jgi:hypothetical protein
MLNSPNIAAAVDNPTVAYIDRLDRTSATVVRFLRDLPLRPETRSEMRDTWEATRRKLAYFRHELLRSTGEARENLEVLHRSMLPNVVAYQVKTGTILLRKECRDSRILDRWHALWKNFSE